MRAYDIEIEERRLHLVLDHQRTRAESKAADDEYFEDTSNPFAQEKRKLLNAQFSHEQDMLGMLHWCQGRNIVAETPKETMVEAPGIVGVIAGELACFRSVSQPGYEHTNNRLYFPAFTTYHVSADGWLVATGPTREGSRSKTFRERLLPVAFKKVELFSQSPSTLTLKILA